MKKLRILIADDQTLMRDGLKTILDLEDDIEVVGTASNGEEVCELAASLQPDLVLMDIRMPRMNGIESMKRIKRDFPEMNVLILTTFDEDDYIIEALIAGAGGFLLKDMPGDKLINAVRDAAEGQSILTSSVAAKLVSRLRSERKFHASATPASFEHPHDIHFTEREKEIISHMIRNLNNRKIAEQLSITEGTLKNYITSIYDKIGTNDRLEAIEILKEMFHNRRDEP